MTEPEHGYLDRLNVGALHPGDTFTQANLDAGEIRFFDYAAGTAPDGFRFMVTDHEGGFFGTPKFVVQPFVGTGEPEQRALDFLLFPNPAGESVQLAFGQALTADTRVSLFDLAGRQMGNWTLGAGASSLTFQVHELPKGIYLVSVNNDEGTGMKKLVVQ
jgi:hypothetical protein